MIGNVHEQVVVLQKKRCCDHLLLWCCREEERMTSASNPIRRLRNLASVIGGRKVPCDDMSVLVPNDDY